MFHTSKWAACGLALFIVFSVCNPTLADIVWDESVDGDLSNVEGNPTLIALILGANDILGDIGGSFDPNVGDGYDVFSFNVGANESITSILLNQYTPAGGNSTTGVNIFSSDGTILGSRAISTADVGQDLLTLTGISPLAEGDYYISMREFTAPGQQYSMTINKVSAIPESSSAMLIACFACFMASSHARRQRQRAPQKSS